GSPRSRAWPSSSPWSGSTSWGTGPGSCSTPACAAEDRKGMAASDLEVRVRYAETDQMGVAHHAAYLVWFEAGRTEFIRVRGRSYAQIEAARVAPGGGRGPLPVPPPRPVRRRRDHPDPPRLPRPRQP